VTIIPSEQLRLSQVLASCLADRMDFRNRSRQNLNVNYASAGTATDNTKLGKTGGYGDGSYSLASTDPSGNYSSKSS
jgi:hypothetical protein